MKSAQLSTHFVNPGAVAWGGEPFSKAPSGKATWSGCLIRPAVTCEIFLATGFAQEHE